MFAVLNIGIIVPVTYFFFPETANMRLEDIDHIFEAGGITRGVIRMNGLPADRRKDIERAIHAPGEIVMTSPSSGSEKGDSIEYVEGKTA